MNKIKINQGNKGLRVGLYQNDLAFTMSGVITQTNGRRDSVMTRMQFAPEGARDLARKIIALADEAERLAAQPAPEPAPRPAAPSAPPPKPEPMHRLTKDEITLRSALLSASWWIDGAFRAAIVATFGNQPWSYKQNTWYRETKDLDREIRHTVSVFAPEQPVKLGSVHMLVVKAREVLQYLNANIWRMKYWPALHRLDKSWGRHMQKLQNAIEAVEGTDPGLRHPSLFETAVATLEASHV